MEFEADVLIGKMSQELGQLNTRAILAETRNAQLEKQVEDLQKQIAEMKKSDESDKDDTDE